MRTYRQHCQTPLVTAASGAAVAWGGAEGTVEVALVGGGERARALWHAHADGEWEAGTQRGRERQR